MVHGVTLVTHLPSETPVPRHELGFQVSLTLLFIGSDDGKACKWVHLSIGSHHVVLITLLYQTPRCLLTPS